MSQAFETASARERLRETRSVSDARSIPDPLSALAGDVTTLFRKEGQLVRAELSEKVSQIEVGAGSLAAGAICLLVALNVLAGALVIALAEWVGAAWSALIVGVVIALIGAILLKKGASDMTNLAPERTVRQAERNANMVREQVR